MFPDKHGCKGYREQKTGPHILVKYIFLGFSWCLWSECDSWSGHSTFRNASFSSFGMQQQCQEQVGVTLCLLMMWSRIGLENSNGTYNLSVWWVFIVCVCVCVCVCV
jgi:hypothetical protein